MASVAQSPSPALSEKDEFAAAVRAAQAEIEIAVDKGGLRDDVLRYPLAAISVALGVFPELVARLDAAAGRVQPASPPPGQEVVDAIERAVKSVVFRLGPEINRRTRITVGIALLGTGLLGGAIGYVAGAVSRPPGPVSVCWQLDGRQVCRPAVWLQNRQK